MTNEAVSEQAMRVTRTCVIVLSLEWIIFGSCHFALPAETGAELPRLFPFKQTVVILSGMIEVATGILVLLPRTRKLAAQTTILLLFLFLLPIFHMLAYDEGLPQGYAIRIMVRILLVPNHILLALAAIHLLSLEHSALNATARLLEGVFASKRSGSNTSGSFVVASVMLLANVAGFIVMWASPWNQTTARMWAMMCLALGATAGFLFGVPRFNSTIAQQAALRPNSNIEKISDWLTKILVGLGLIEFRKIGRFVNDLSTQLGGSLLTNPLVQRKDDSISFAKALIVYFFCAGAIQGYLLTRLYLTEQFDRRATVNTVPAA